MTDKIISVRDTGEAEQLLRLSKIELVDIIDKLTQELQKASYELLKRGPNGNDVQAD